MAVFYDSHQSKLFISDTSSSSQDMTVYVRSIDGLPGMRKLNEITTFGSVGYRYSPGLEENTINLELVYSVDATVGTDTVIGPLRTASTSHTFTFYPTGTTTGNVTYSGSLWVDDYTIQSRINNAIFAKASLKVDNGVARATL